MSRYLTFASILFASGFYWGHDFHGTRAFVFLILGALWISASVWRRIHWSAALSLAWTLVSAATVYGKPISPFAPLGDYAVLGFDAIAASSTIFILLTVVPLLLSDQKVLRSLTGAFGWLCILDSVYVLGEWALGCSSVDRGGFFGNASINACVIACTYNIWNRGSRRPNDLIEAFGALFGAFIPILAIFASRSNMALIALIASIAFPYLVEAVRRLRWRSAATAAIISSILLLCGRSFMGEKFGGDSGRYPLWAGTMRWWWAHANHWVGTGTGTFFILGPNIQIQDLHQNTGHFFWLHNDWLQILFEQGAVGLALALLVFGFAISRCIQARRYWLLSSLVAYGTTMLGNFPMHLPIPGLLGAFLIRLTYELGPSAARLKPEKRSL